MPYDVELIEQNGRLRGATAHRVMEHLFLYPSPPDVPPGLRHVYPTTSIDSAAYRAGVIDLAKENHFNIPDRQLPTFFDSPKVRVQSPSQFTGMSKEVPKRIKSMWSVDPLVVVP